MKKVYLVGAGPGDPELLTLKGKRVIEKADVILYDHLANAALLDLAPRDAERIYVGKKRADHTFPQQDITEMLLEQARLGKNVVRLKGGDPFIFGRGGEEVEALAEAGIPYEVVPGVTAPLGIAAYTGVPLTHREHTSVVTFVTGHTLEGIDWARFGTSETLVIFMGLHFLPEIVEKLLESGRSPGTPAMAVRWGTRPDQQTVQATLGTLADASAGMKPPATVIVGDVVSLRKKLDWFERLPLHGKQVVVTRAREQASDLSLMLHEMGAEVIELPVIEMAPLEDYGALDGALQRLGEYDWLIFTSANAVEYFLQRMDASGFDWRAFAGNLCAIGPATAAALRACHMKVDLLPARAVAESVVEAFAPFEMEGARVLLPRASAAREVVPEALRNRGAVVDVIDAYRNVVPREAAESASKIFGGKRRPDWVTFTSSSTVKNLLALVGPTALEGVRTASIGPVTSETLRMHGLPVTAEAKTASMDALVEAVLAGS